MTTRTWMAIIAVCMLPFTGAVHAAAEAGGSNEPRLEETSAPGKAAPEKEQKKALSTPRKIAGFGVLGVLIVWIFTRDVMARKRAKREGKPDHDDSDAGEGN